MKIFDLSITDDNGEMIIHLQGDNANYTVTYDNGKMTFENAGLRYVVPSDKGDALRFKRPDRSTGEWKYNLASVRTLHRDTTPTDFGVSNIIDAEPSSTHFTEEVTVGGINHVVAVIAPESVTIYVNDSPVVSGTLVTTGDVVKFEITAPATTNVAQDISFSIGDISKTISVSSRLLTSVSYIGYNAFATADTTTTSYTLGYPANMQIGDMLIATFYFDAHTSGPTPTSSSLPIGFNFIGAGATSGEATEYPRAFMMYKIVDGTESGNITVPSTEVGSTDYSAVVMLYRGDSPINNVEVIDYQNSHGPDDLTTSMSGSTATPVALGIATLTGRSTTQTPILTWSSADQIVTCSDASMTTGLLKIAYKAFPTGSTPGNYSLTSTDTGRQSLATTVLNLS